MGRWLIFSALLLSFACVWGPQAFAENGDVILLYSGYLTRIRCEGRLLISAIGNEELVRLEALPKELGCGALLKPRAQSGQTNLVLEMSTGTLTRRVEISPHSPSANEKFEVLLKSFEPVQREGR